MKIHFANFAFYNDKSDKLFIKNSIFFLLIFLSLSCSFNRNSTSINQNSTVDILIHNINIIDVENNTLLHNQDVLITGKTITDILPHGQRKVVAASVIDGAGKYLIPGLWDMHVHTLNEDWYQWQFPFQFV